MKLSQIPTKSQLVGSEEFLAYDGQAQTDSKKDVRISINDLKGFIGTGLTIYGSEADGLAATADQGYFLVINPDNPTTVAFYQRDGSDATNLTNTLDASAIAQIQETANEVATYALSATYRQSSIAPVDNVITIDASANTIVKVDLAATANLVITPGTLDGSGHCTVLTVYLKQTVGAAQLTYDNKIKFANDLPPVLSNDAGKTDVISFQCFFDEGDFHAFGFSTGPGFNA